MPETDDKNALPQAASAKAAGRRRELRRRTNLLGGDSSAAEAFEQGAQRETPFTQGRSGVDPFKVRGA